MSSKTFKTYDELIEHLKSKGLIITDEDQTKALLKQHSYFDLINGYKYPFKNKQGIFKKGTSVSDIYYLYRFDDQIRFALLKKIMAVEIHIKSLLSYSFCQEYGDKSSEYLNVTNYNYSNEQKLQPEINKLVNVLDSTLKEYHRFTYMEHQHKNYGNIPLWVLMKALTFGNISVMYSVQKNHIQAQISKEFPGINEKDLTSFLKLLTKFRNVCAHNERLFDFKTKKEQIRNQKIYADLFPNISSQRNNLFAVLISLKYLLSDDSFCELVDEIDKSISELFIKTHQIQKPQLFKYMGFPNNWKDIKNYKITA